MKLGNAIIYNGKFYRAGEESPMKELNEPEVKPTEKELNEPEVKPTKRGKRTARKD